MKDLEKMLFYKTKRKSNPKPASYYISKMEQDCMIELYISSLLSQWKTETIINDAENIEQCFS
ncbi:hypothetical protein T4E_6049 [Trichinella pseudospiralis]|nr:hypothetical protein T4E_6049 [Trichinella pseudospiralis]